MKRMMLLILSSLFLLFPLSVFASGYDISPGVTVQLNQVCTLRSGPGNQYAGLGKYGKDDQILYAYSAVRGSSGGWWIQIEIRSDGRARRGYVSADDVNLDPSSLPKESQLGQAQVTQSSTLAYGPGSGYGHAKSTVENGSTVTIINYENGYAQIEYTDESGKIQRGWISSNAL